MTRLAHLIAASAALGLIAAAPAPVKLTKAQLDQVVAGNPNANANGTIDGSNGASGAPGNSWDGGKKSPGQTGNPHPSR